MRESGHRFFGPSSCNGNARPLQSLAEPRVTVTRPIASCRVASRLVSPDRSEPTNSCAEFRGEDLDGDRCDESGRVSRFAGASAGQARSSRAVIVQCSEKETPNCWCGAARYGYRTTPGVVNLETSPVRESGDTRELSVSKNFAEKTKAIRRRESLENILLSRSPPP